jgi:2-amino-4-hydroxy-6-hydroxymethyldihydropteridine diphosphokinase
LKRREAVHAKERIAEAMTVLAYIALGSNQGDRRDYLNRALQSIAARPGVSLTRVSSYHETAPVGGPPGQEDFLNAACEVQTELSPETLLGLLLDVERELGRVRRERHGPRTVDLDLLLYGDVVRNEADLIIPHPRMHERGFVLEPLVEIAPNAVHPLLGYTVKELREQLEQTNAASVLSLAARELSGLRAVVTGSTSGIGRAIALELATAGADVVIHRRNPGGLAEPAAAEIRAQAEQVADAVRAHDVRSQVILADLRQREECRRLAELAWQTWGGVDIWINNAGADTLTGEAGDWSFEQKLGELLAVDVIATILLSRDAGMRMKAAGKGVLINMGWDQAETGMDGDSGQLFSASKAAVMAFSKSLALSLAPEVRVNCLAPGWIRTSWGEKASNYWQERACRETPLGRWGKPEDVAVVARWLASSAASFVTGQVIRVNGGAVR